MRESVFQLIGKPRINRFNFQLNKEYNFNGEIKLELSNNIKVLRGIDENAHRAIVILDIGIFESHEKEEVPFQIHVEIEGHFKWDEILDKEEAMLEKMLKENAPAILYCYVRPQITSITVEANMPPLVVPLMNFQKD